MTKPNQPTRICTTCGLKKPLTSFLEVGGSQGTAYGNMCADCRRKGKDAKKNWQNIDGEDERSSASGLRVGAKQKIASDMEIQRQYKDLKDLYRKDLLKRDQNELNKAFKLETIQKAEKEHRFYLEQKKQSFLSGTRPAESKNARVVEAAKERLRNDIFQQEKQAENLESKNQEELSQHILRLTTTDLAVSFLSPQYTDLRYRSPLFLRFVKWLGTGAPVAHASVMKALDQMYNKTPAELTKEFSNKSHKDGEKQQAKHEKKDVLLEYIDKAWGPSSSKRR